VIQSTGETIKEGGDLPLAEREFQHCDRATVPTPGWPPWRSGRRDVWQMTAVVAIDLVLLY